MPQMIDEWQKSCMEAARARIIVETSPDAGMGRIQGRGAIVRVRSNMQAENASEHSPALVLESVKNSVPE